MTRNSSTTFAPSAFRRLLAEAREAFRELAEIQFGAPWRRPSGRR
jgi:hypothetical protein